MRLVKTVIAALICAVIVNGQTNRGAISGTVVDQNGAAVPGATVTVTNLGTNQVSTVSTSSAGSLLQLLPSSPGSGTGCKGSRPDPIRISCILQ